MKTISAREFVANPEMYLGIAREQEVRVKKGREMFHIVYEAATPSLPPQPFLEPDDDLRRAITVDELLKGIHEDIDRKWAERRK